MRGMIRAMMWSLVALICFVSRPAAGGPQGAAGTQVDKSSIGGVVTNANGGNAEAGVWVIAETKSLPVPFRKIVVTDDQGRFLVPGLIGTRMHLLQIGKSRQSSEADKCSTGN